MLDTLQGSFAGKVYLHHGWRRAGEIPDYAADPYRKLFPTLYFYKHLKK